MMNMFLIKILKLLEKMDREKAPLLKDLAFINLNKNILINNLDISQHDIDIIRKEFYTSINDILPCTKYF